MKIKDQYEEYLKLKEIWYAPAGLQRGTISHIPVGVSALDNLNARRYNLIIDKIMKEIHNAIV